MDEQPNVYTLLDMVTDQVKDLVGQVHENQDNIRELQAKVYALESELRQVKQELHLRYIDGADDA